MVMGFIVGYLNYVFIDFASADCIATTKLVLNRESVSSPTVTDTQELQKETEKWEKEAFISDNWFSSNHFNILFSSYEHQEQ
jgi:hypothetical protein